MENTNREDHPQAEDDGTLAIQEQEVREGKCRHEDAADQIPDASAYQVRQVAEERNGQELNGSGDANCIQDDLWIEMDLGQVIGDDKRGEEVEWSLLSKTCASAEQNLWC